MSEHRSKKYSQLPSEKTIRLFLMRFYLVGALGFAIPVLKPYFIKLTPFILLISFTLILLYELTVNRKRGRGYFITYVIVVGILAYLVEMAGVNTGVIFGHYNYEKGLGFQIAQTPPVIGFTWVVLVLGSASLSHGMSTSLGFSSTRYIDAFFRILCATLLMILMDLVLEKVAGWLEWWTWTTPRVPGRNYLSWIILSLIFHSYYVFGRIQQRTNVAATIFILQFLLVTSVFMYIRFFR